MPIRITWLSICLLFALAMLAACTSLAQTTVGSRSSTPTSAAVVPTATVEREPTAEEVAAAEAELARYTMLALARRAAGSLDRLVDGSSIVVVGTVTSVGPMLTRPMSEGSGWYFLSLSYEARTERYLKGSGPSTIRIAQTEGYLPTALTPTLARIRAAQRRYSSDFRPMLVGARYLFFLHRPHREPMLGDADLYSPASYYPHRYRIATDGSAAMDTPGDIALPTRMPERELIERTERAIAAEELLTK